MNRIFGLTVLALSFVACENSGNDSRAVTNAPATAPSFSAPITPIKADSGKQQSVTTAPAAAPVQTTTSKGAVNPAHGMPGHRCDIPEGAPLNSAPISTSIPANAGPSLVQPPAPAGKSVKLNPAHGQPGHDCAVAVGQPLPS